MIRVEPIGNEVGRSVDKNKQELKKPFDKIYRNRGKTTIMDQTKL